jgi:hypothetical protein
VTGPPACDACVDEYGGDDLGPCPAECATCGAEHCPAEPCHEDDDLWRDPNDESGV